MSNRIGKACCEKIKGNIFGGRNRHAAYRKFMKRQKVRAERRRAKSDPDCTPGYKKHSGWEW